MTRLSRRAIQGTLIETIVPGAGIDVDDTDPENPIIAATAAASFSGYVPFAAGAGYQPDPGSTVAPTSQGKAVPLTLAGPMKLRGLVVEVSAAASGTVQWGLFDPSSNAASATKVAGGSGALNSTGAVMIPATSAPVSIAAGAYILVIAFPATNVPTVLRRNLITSIVPWNRVWTSYTWTDNPDFTSASWAASTSPINMYLKGDLDSSGHALW